MSSEPLTFEGRGSTNTRPFTLNGNYTMDWDASPNNSINSAYCSVTLTPTEQRGVSSFGNSLISKSIQGDERGSTVIYSAKGDYYFRVNGCGIWTLSVTPLR